MTRWQNWLSSPWSVDQASEVFFNRCLFGNRVENLSIAWVLFLLGEGFFIKGSTSFPIHGYLCRAFNDSGDRVIAHCISRWLFCWAMDQKDQPFIYRSLERWNEPSWTINDARTIAIICSRWFFERTRDKLCESCSSSARFGCRVHNLAWQNWFGHVSKWKGVLEMKLASAWLSD